MPACPVQPPTGRHPRALLMLPAHDTKHVAHLSVPFQSTNFRLAQRVSPLSNGTALWLCGQILALYIAYEYPTARASKHTLNAHGEHDNNMRTACELGSGVGLTALALASMGWNVLATDVPVIADGVLRENITANSVNSDETWGKVVARTVEWGEPLAMEDWDVRPPYDMIVTADTIYSPDLVSPLFRTLRALAEVSFPEGKKSSCPVLVCLERRDPMLTDAALKEASGVWGFVVKRVPQNKVAKAAEKGGIRRDELQGVEIWKLILQRVVK